MGYEEEVCRGSPMKGPRYYVYYLSIRCVISDNTFFFTSFYLLYKNTSIILYYNPVFQVYLATSVGHGRVGAFSGHLLSIYIHKCIIMYGRRPWWDIHMIVLFLVITVFSLWNVLSLCVWVSQQWGWLEKRFGHSVGQ